MWRVARAVPCRATRCRCERREDRGVNDPPKILSEHHLRRPPQRKQLRRRHALHRDAAVDQPEALQPSGDERRAKIAAGVGVAGGAARDARRLLRAELAVHLGQIVAAARAWRVVEVRTVSSCVWV